MTLHTRIVTDKPVPVQELMDFINSELLHATDPITEDGVDTEWDWNPETGTGNWVDKGARSLANAPGQGFDAWAWVDYRPDGMLRAVPQWYEIDEDGEPDYDNVYSAETPKHPEAHLSEPAAGVEINFDTAYGYRSDAGYGCGTLHALYIVRIGQWLQERGVSWLWYNEFTGDWHPGFDYLDGLSDSGRKANVWWENVVKPAIETELIFSE